MSIRSHLVGLAVALAGVTVLVPSTARCEVLIRQNFEQTDTFPAGSQPVGAIAKWEDGDEGPLGAITIATVDTANGPTKAAQIGNVAHPENRAPGLLLSWSDRSSGTVRVEYRFMTPIAGSFYSTHYFGGSWDTSAAILVVKDGRLWLQYGEGGARLSLGSYAANEWHTFRADFDVTGRTVDVYLNGKQLSNRLPWQPRANGVETANLYADFTRVDHCGAPVLFVDDITVETVLPASTTQPATVPREPATPKAQGRSFRYGVNSHLVRYKGADFDKLIDAIDRLGVDVVRDGVDWNSLQPTEQTWTFGRMDKIVNDLAARGVELQPLLAFSAKWASTGRTDTGDWHDWNNRAPRIEPFNAYATAMVNRYKDRIGHWEIWNEPEIAFWLSTPAEYVELFNSASAAIKKADPNAKVLNGGFAMERRPPNMNFLPEFLAGADTTHWDIWAFHDYNTFGQMIARERLSRRYYESKNLTIPIWINEGGFNMLTRGGEAAQAVNLAKKMAAAPSMGIEAYMWYDLIDDGDEPLDPEHHFGLLNRNFKPKPAFIAYQHLIRELSPRTFAKRLAEDDALSGLWGLLYQSPNDQNDHVLVLWREGEGRQTPLWVGTRGKGAATTVYAMNGAPITVPQLDGGLLVTVSDAPVYVHLKGSLDPIVRPMLSLPEKLAILPGRDNALRLQLANPTDHDVTFGVTASASSPSLRLSAPPSDVRLAAGQSTSLTLNASLNDSAVAETNGTITVSLRPTADGPTVDAQLAYVAASAIPKLPDASASDVPGEQGLSLKTDTVDSIVNLFSAEPNPTMHWHGPTDLSAAARIAYTADALLLHVTATDDAHAQQYDGAEIWRGDAIQFAVRTDDAQPVYFEAGIALAKDGKPQGWVYSVPTGSSLKLGAMDKQIAYDVQRDDTQTHYVIRVPWKAFGIDGQPKDGLRLNYIVNDDDGQGRKGWVQLSDGIGKDKNANLFRLFVCD